MSPAEVLELARERQVSLWAGPAGQMCWRCEGPLPDGLRPLLAEHKAGLLELLPPPWDQAEADRLLAEVRAAVAHAEAEHRAGRLSAVKLNVVRLWQEIAQDQVANHEAEAGRGRDPMKMVRDVARHASALAVVK